MALSPGLNVGAYRIIGRLGAGGMGEVYRAHDSKLKRDVAIKVLPAEFAQDAQRVARFRREAEFLASMAHPHIGAIYDFETVEGLQFLVLELIEGETLSQRIARGPIPIDETLQIAAQIAEAMEAAHEKGIIHRDLKPANVKLLPDDTVKVLDFGLAKMWETGRSNGNLSNSPTLLSDSVPGAILGTAAYMSPEQAKGRETDRRSDVWSFGCVLYEMLTGEAAFQGETLAEVVAAVMRAEPNWDRLPPDTPAAVRRLLQRCLQKDYRRRLQCIGDARLELTEVLSPSGVERIPASGVQRRERTAWIAFAAAAIVAAVIGVYALRPASRSPEMRFDIVTPPSADPTTFALSPDGLKLAFAGDSGNPVLWLRELDSGKVLALPGTDNAEFPFWSADSRSLGFFAGGKLKRIDIDTGLIRVLADAAGRGGAWNQDGIILFAPGANTSIFKMSSDGGQTTPVTRLKGQQGTHRQPHFLPDGRHFLFWGQDGGVETRAVYAGDIDGSEPKLIVNSDVSAEFSPTGQLIFFRDNKLFAQPFDPAQLSLTGSPTLLADQVLFTPGYNVAALSASPAGPIAYRTGAPATKRLVWIDRNTGKETEAVGNADQASPMGVSLSPDGRRIALARTLSGNIDVWLLETARGVLSRFTSDPSRQRWPLWSPDGGRIAFGSNLKGTYDLYQKPADGSGSEELLLATPQSKSPADWSPDGAFLLFGSQDPKTGYDLWALRVKEPGKAFPLVRTDFEDGRGQFSPDGKWIAYESNESGRFQIYAQPFPGPGIKTQISLNGGAQVRWRPDGKALFYIALDSRLMEVPLEFGSDGKMINPGSPVALFTTHIGGAVQSNDGQQYVVSKDGRRFLMNTIVEETANSPITVILNWSVH